MTRMDTRARENRNPLHRYIGFDSRFTIQVFNDSEASPAFLAFLT